MANDNRVVAENYERVDPVVPMYNRELINILLVGGGVGLIVSGAAYLLNRFVFDALLCQGEQTAECANAPEYAMIVAMVIGAILGLVALVQTRVYRPLLVVLGVSIGLWGFHGLTQDMAWYWALGIMVVTFGLSYALFAWVVRLRSFIVALIVTVVLVALMQLVIHS